MARLRFVVSLVALALTALVAFAAPAGAQQLIDASEDGGAAFLAFAIMVFLFTGSLFYMDHVRRKREER
jgi:hypothetical protein